MRCLVLILPFALLACGQQQSASRSGCAQSASHQITWSNPTAPDTVTARADGPSCKQAAVTFTIRDAQGDPLWAFASTHYAMTAGDGAMSGDAPDVPEASMAEFLANWADVTMQNSGELPEWRHGEPTLRGETFSYHTDFEREAYEMLRSRDLPMACFAGGAETSQCLVIDPLSNAPALLVAYGP